MTRSAGIAFSSSVRQTNQCNNMRHSSRWCYSCALLISLLCGLCSASPRHKYPKLKFRDNDIAPGSSVDTCKMSEPCGWALYVPGSSPRKIYKYTRNTFCSCSGGTVCSLARDALPAFVCLLLPSKGDLKIQVS